MTSNQLFPVVFGAFLVCCVSFFTRNRAPRFAMLSIGLLLIVSAAWLGLKTFELASMDQAYAIGRGLRVFDKATSPESFSTSVWFHSLMAVLVAVVGVFLMIAAAFGRNVTFDRPATYFSARPISGSLVLPIAAGACMVFAVVWLTLK